MESQRLTLSFPRYWTTKDGDEEEDDESMDLHDSEDEEEALPLEAGSLVQLTASGFLGVVEKVDDSMAQVT